MTYSRLRTSAGRKSSMPRAGWVLADDIELALEYFAGNHNLKWSCVSSAGGRNRVSTDYTDFTDYRRVLRGSKDSGQTSPGRDPFKTICLICLICEICVICGHHRLLESL